MIKVAIASGLVIGAIILIVCYMPQRTTHQSLMQTNEEMAIAVLEQGLYPKIHGLRQKGVEVSRLSELSLDNGLPQFKKSGDDLVYGSYFFSLSEDKSLIASPATEGLFYFLIDINGQLKRKNKQTLEWEPFALRRSPSRKNLP
jgi:hypothetical protein